MTLAPNEHEPWTTERLRNEIRRWRMYDYETNEILRALRTHVPDLRPVVTDEQVAIVTREIMGGQL